MNLYFSGYRPLIWVFSFMLVAACSKDNGQTDADKVAIRKAIAEAGMLDDSGHHELVVQRLQKTFNSGVRATPLDLLNKYEIIIDNYLHYSNATDTVDMFLDSMETILAGFDVKPVDKEIFYQLARGRTAYRQKKYDEAFQHYYKGKLLLDNNKDLCRSQRYTNALASLLFKEESYEEAIRYYKESMQRGTMCEDSSDFDQVIALRQMAANNTGLCFEVMKQYDSALYYYDHTLAFLEANKHRFPEKIYYVNKAKGVLLGNKGGVLAKLGKYKEAEPLLRQSIQINDHPEMDKGDAILTKIKLADLLIQKTDSRNEGIGYMNEIISDLKQYPNPAAEMRLADISYRLYEQLGQYEKANNYLERRTYLRDSIQATSYKMNRKSDYIRNFEQAKYKLELDLLQTENEVKNRYLLFAIALLAMGGVIMVLLVYRRRQQREYIASLKELNTRVQVTNKKLQQSLTSLEHSHEENKQLIKVVAHDLRSPLSGILGLIALLKSEELSKDEMEEYLKLAEQSGNNAMNFISDLLQTNMTTGVIEKSETDLTALIESSISINQPQVVEKHQLVQFSSPPVWANVNEEKIWRVMNNLLSNAIKFSRVGSVIHVGLESKDDVVRISVKDKGIGVPDDLKEHLFDMFTRASRKGTNGEETHGLGLAISKQIIEAHHGRIWVESEYGKGSTFWVELPRK